MTTTPTLRRLRLDRRLRVASVAVPLGVDVETVYRWERGTRVPTARNLAALADLYQVDAGVILAAVMTPRHDDPPADVPIAPQSLTEAS